MGIMRFSHPIILKLPLLISCAAAVAPARTRIMAGKVVAKSGEPQEGAVVQIKNVPGLDSRSFLVRADGSFQFTGPNPDGLLGKSQLRRAMKQRAFREPVDFQARAEVVRTFISSPADKPTRPADRACRERPISRVDDPRISTSRFRRFSDFWPTRRLVS